MRICHQIKSRCSYRVTAALGAGIFIGGFISDGFDLGDFRGVGVVIMIGAIARAAINPALQPQVDLYRAGQEVGYAHGFEDGHREARPVVVPLHCIHELQEQHS